MPAARWRDALAASTYLLYLAAVLLLIVTPGPTMLMCVTNALNHGTARSMASVAGAVLANIGIMALSALGLGALLAASEAAFTTLKVVGAVYLVWLGIKTFRGSGALQPGDVPAGQRSLFLQGVLVAASNPKSLVFFAAFFPQFIDPSRPVTGQFVTLAATFMVGDFIVMFCCAIGVGRLAPKLREAHVVRWINRTCGGLFALLGGLLLLSRRHA